MSPRNITSQSTGRICGNGVTMKISIRSNPWTLPGPPTHLEGRPSRSDLEREESEAAAKREAWEPGPQAFALLDQLRKFVGCEVIIQGWDPIMFLLDDEGPYPLRATCVDVITRNDPDGHLRAYLAIKDPSVVPTSAGYDGLKQLVPAGDSWLFGIDRLYEIETTKPQ